MNLFSAVGVSFITYMKRIVSFTFPLASNSQPGEIWAPRRHLAMSTDSFDCHDLGELLLPRG